MKVRSSSRQFVTVISGVLAVSGFVAQAQEASTTDGDTVTAATTDETQHCSEHHFSQGGEQPEQMMQQFFDELGLTGQQQTDIQIITSDYAERFRDLARLGRTTAEELMSLEPDDPAYRDKTDEASAVAATSTAA